MRERAGQSKAHYEVATSTIAIPLGTQWAARESVILHEVAHHLCSGRQAAADGRRDWHGPRFRSVMCDLVAVVLGEPAALLLRAGYEEAGLPVAAPPGGTDVSATLDRISALLAKAERTDNEAEADAYLMKAQQLATLASVDLAVARARIARREARQQPESRTTSIGEKGRRANPHLISLFVAVAHANDAKVDVAANSTYVIGYGMPADLDVVETMFASLAVHMVHAGQAFVAAGSWRTETYLAAVARTRRREHRPHTAQTARAAFYRAYVERISERLEQARRAALDQLEAHRRPRDGHSGEPSAERPSGEVVLRQKAAEVTSFHKQSSKARGSWGGYSGAVRLSTGSAAEAGRSAASRARLTRQSELPGKGPAIPG